MALVYRTFGLVFVSFFWNVLHALPAYWQSGGAEISTYNLDQARYYDNHPGQAILIFVSEPFLSGKQVKLESAWTPDTVNVLKLNRIDRFVTGIYDYSIMTSVFAPEASPALKVTLSSQDWCGQSWSQLNRRNDRYLHTLRSYFEKEADSETRIDKGIPEDEMFLRIRLDPGKLPTGSVLMIPSLSSSRLLHRPLQAENAQVTLSKTQGRQFYEIRYTEARRSLRIEFEDKSPYRITGWEESQILFNGRTGVTKAKLMHTIRARYWEQNRPAERKLRKELGL